jgi:hypothetical protein
MISIRSGDLARNHGILIKCVNRAQTVMAAERNIARTPMTTATLDAVEAEELAEILEYFLELLDLLVNPDHDAVDFSEGNLYGADDLRADLTRLVERLRTSPITS